MKAYDFKYIDPETGLTFEYDASRGVVYVSASGECGMAADKLEVGRNQRFIRSRVLRLVKRYKDSGGRKYSEWREAEDYIQLSLTGGMGLVV